MASLKGLGDAAGAAVVAGVPQSPAIIDETRTAAPVTVRTVVIINY
jgi:hypothetical protein